MHKKPLASFNGVKVYEVDGAAVRRKNIVFVEGGHGRVYPSFIPKNEVWVEKMLSKTDQNYILMHELTEFFLMRDRTLKYNEAHDKANEVERCLRTRKARKR